MNNVLDNALVTVALIVAAGYALMALGPRTLRRRLLAAISEMLRRAPRVLFLSGLAQRASAAANKGQSACGGCDGCGPAETKTADGEVRVPVGKIGRRG